MSKRGRCSNLVHHKPSPNRMETSLAMCVSSCRRSGNSSGGKKRVCGRGSICRTMGVVARAAAGLVVVIEVAADRDYCFFFFFFTL